LSGKEPELWKRRKRKRGVGVWAERKCEDEQRTRRRRATKLHPEQIERVLARLNKPKMLHVEVTPKTFRAVQANPGELRLIAKDANGNTLTDRPHRLSDAEIRARNEEYLRNRQSVGGGGPEFGRPQDQYWEGRRGWNGEVYYRPDDGSRNEYVVSDYDIFAVLRR
jgi:hypothetical protein